MKKLILLIIVGMIVINLVYAQGFDWGRNTQRDFSVNNNFYECVENGEVWKSSDGTTDPSSEDCYREDNPGIDSYTRTCCPSEKTCDTGAGECILSDPVINFCDDYDNENDCENANSGIAEATIDRNTNGKGSCGLQIYDQSLACNVLVNCLCSWREDEDGIESCMAIESSTTGNCDNSNNNGKSGLCIRSVGKIIGDCDVDDERTYFVNATWQGDDIPSKKAECQSTSQAVPCADSIIKLPMFGFINLLVACLVIFGYYIIKD